MGSLVQPLLRLVGNPAEVPPVLPVPPVPLVPPLTGRLLLGLLVGATADDLVALGEPAGPRLLFAGEATVPAYYGTVAAAMISGLREAERMLST